MNNSISRIQKLSKTRRSKHNEESPNQECHYGSILDEIKSTRSNTNCSDVDHHDECGI